MTKNKFESEKIAGRLYEASDYTRKDETSSGLAVTHEQVSDSLTEGTIDGVIEDVDGQDIPLQSRKSKK